MAVVMLVWAAATLALEHAPRYPAQIKDWMHRRTGYHVEFSQVSPALHWHGPELVFDHPELRSKDGRRVLARAASGRIGVDVSQVFHGGALWAVRVELDAPVAAITRMGPRRFALAGELELGGEGPAGGLALDDLPHGRLVVRHGTVTLRQWNAALPTLELHGLQADVRHAGTEVNFALAADLPGPLGGAFDVNGLAQGHGPLAAADWSVLAKTRGLSFPGWRLLLPGYLDRLDAGSGGFEVAARGRGAVLAHADLDFAADGVVARSGDGRSARFEHLGGALALTHAGERWTLRGRRVQASHAGGADPDASFDVSWRAGATGLLDLQATAGYLRLDALLPLAGLLPQGDLRARLQELAPSGEWLDTRLDLARAAVDQPWTFNVRTRFRDLGFAAVGRAPGLRGLSGSAAGNERGGRIDLSSSALVYSWPAQFPQPVDVQRFATTLYWSRTPDSLLVATQALELKTRDAVVRARLAWRQPADGGSPVMTLAATVDEGNVAAAHNYLPRGYIAPSALTWLNRALVSGRLPHADVVIQGPLRHFPFRDGSGLFLARCRIEALTLDYHDGWPRAENLAVLAEFRNQGLTVQLAGGRIQALALTSGQASFADFKTGELQVQVQAKGDAADALAYLRATPLDAIAEHAFSNVDAQGPLESKVDLFLPFKDFARRRVQVQAQLAGVSLHRPGSTLSATELGGDVDFDNGQVARADLHGRLLGGAFQMQAHAPRSGPPTRTQLEFRGTLTGEALHDALSLPANLPIGGAADWQGVLKMAPAPNRERSLRLTSSLAGFELNLPEPLAKPAGRPLPTSVEVQWPAGGPSQLRIALGSVLGAAFSLDFDQNVPRLGRATVNFGDAAPPPLSDAQTLNTGGRIDRFDLAGWLKLYAPDKNSKPVAGYVADAKFKVRQLDYLGLSFLDLALDLSVQNGTWRIGVGGPNVDGLLTLPGADSGVPWNLEFRRLAFIDGPGETDVGKGADAKGVDAQGSANAKGGNPHGIPALKFHAAQLKWGEREFGEVRATLAKLNDGISLQDLKVTTPMYAVDAKGEWRGRDAGVARIEGDITSTDVGGALKQLGYAAVLEAKTGKMDFDLSWAGAPSAQALGAAVGRVAVTLDDGQVTGINPGAGRVLGLASLAALPRRLSLDFSDLTDKGLAFDTVRADFDLRGGDAYTDNVLLKGPAAEIGLIGRVGLKNKDYDQTAVVTGRIDSALPLAAFAGGPVVGAAVLLFTQVFKEPLEGLARAYYRITGPWESPNVERIKSSDAAGTTAEVPK